MGKTGINGRKTAYFRNRYQMATIITNRTIPMPITVMLLISFDSSAM